MTVMDTPEQKATLALLQKQAEQTGDKTLLNLYLKQLEAMGGAAVPPLPSLDDDATRERLFATPAGDDYFEEQILPPAELFRFLSEADAGDLDAAELENIEKQVVDWCTKRYAPPAHLGFYVDFSEALVQVGESAPLELWLTRRQWCAGY